MTARVDAAAGAVVDGDRSWLLRLDARTGGAVVTVDGRDIAVTPLGWRHKQRLAGWAHLGAALVADQRVALAVEPGAALDDDERAVVDAVAHFLDGDALPLAPEVLAEVTTELCRATGLPPAAFDDRDARDVEVMWRASAGASPGTQPGRAMAPTVGRSAPAFDDWAAGTSIVFTADETLPVPPPPDIGGHPVAGLEAAANPADGPPGPVGSVPSAESASRSPVAGDSAAQAISSPRAPTAQQPRGARDEPRYRVAPTASPPRRPRTDAHPTRPAAPSRARRPPEARQPYAATDATLSPGGEGRGAPRRHPAATLLMTVPGDGDVAAYAFDPHPLTPPLPARVSTPHDTAANAGPATDFDALAAAVADRLAEQLAEATDDLGLEV